MHFSSAYTDNRFYGPQLITVGIQGNLTINTDSNLNLTLNPNPNTNPKPNSPYTLHKLFTDNTYCQ